MNRVKMTISLGAGLVQRIQALKEKSGYSKSRVIEEAIERGLAQTEKVLGKRGLK